LRSKSPDPKRDKIACVRMIGKDMRKDIDLSDLKYEMNIQNLFTLTSVSVAAIIKEKNKKAGLFKWREP
jgi:hypothetical protein